MTTATNIHSRSTPPTPPAPPAPQDIKSIVQRIQARPLEQIRHGASPVGNVGRPPSRWNPERERPEDDEAVITAVLAPAIHRSFRERPEDDEVIPTYTSEPACRHVR